MRRRVREEDSLELLLDTICNVFGGVIFIAILLAIMPTAEAPEPIPTRERIKVSEVELRELELEQENLQRTAVQFEKLLERLAPDEVAVAASELEALEEAGVELDRRVREVQDAVNSMRREVSDIDLAVKRTEQTVAQLGDRLARAQGAQGVLRLPRARATDRGQIIGMLKGGRLYLIPLGAGAGLVQTAAPGQVELQNLFGDGWLVRPHANAGLPINGGNPPAAFDRLLEAADPARLCVYLFVYADSIKAFREVRTFAASRGFAYNVVPSAGDLILSSADSSVQVQ